MTTASHLPRAFFITFCCNILRTPLSCYRFLALLLLVASSSAGAAASACGRAGGPGGGGACLAPNDDDDGAGEPTLPPDLRRENVRRVVVRPCAAS